MPPRVQTINWASLGQLSFFCNVNRLHHASPLFSRPKAAQASQMSDFSPHGVAKYTPEPESRDKNEMLMLIRLCTCSHGVELCMAFRYEPVQVRRVNNVIKLLSTTGERTGKPQYFRAVLLKVLLRRSSCFHRTFESCRGMFSSHFGTQLLS
ncbi:uncharacterized protein FOMMEDRAFT_159187 [Fomitiporia mediterranea MF3/22]|uniref:uncharacterized protein n=1 Tax=Fomitiporia mediterranea (strain MF3/22) TaxID=694068 RepID=UPI0004407FB7|nr:uncharacterized protein FOMMEDRAFT_159187 [Fomitiporia mediterranea MF3/22]EJD00484.1 hypothetical protein FOMMEDRAFT_159187 [Fomitiporia mediterranea MF3/22]